MLSLLRSQRQRPVGVKFEMRHVSSFGQSLTLVS